MSKMAAAWRSSRLCGHLKIGHLAQKTIMACMPFRLRATKPRFFAKSSKRQGPITMYICQTGSKIWSDTNAAENLYCCTRSSNGTSVFYMLITIWLASILMLSEYAGGAEACVIWKKIPYQVVRGDSLSKIATKTHITVTALRVFNHLEDTVIRPGMCLHFPEIELVAGDNSSRNRSQPANIEAWQVYSASRRCYAMILFLDGSSGEDAYTLGVFVLDGASWRETDRYANVLPVDWVLKYRLKTLAPDVSGNEGACCYLEFIASTKDSGIEGLAHIPAVSPHLHGVQVIQHAFSVGARQMEYLPDMDIYEEDIGAAWPEALKGTRDTMLRNGMNGVLNISR
jgi:hypothetical protein